MIEDKSSLMEQGRRLKLLRSMTGLSKKDFCAKYQISSTTLHYWEHGINSGISEKGAKKIVEIMRLEGVQCTMPWLLHGLGVYPHFIDARYSADTIQYDDKISTGINNEKVIHYEIERFRQLNASAITLAIVDDSMDPFYHIGDYVGGKKRQTENVDKFVDHDCIIETEDRQLICRRLTSGSKQGFYNLYCTNPKTSVYPPILYNTKILSAAPIIRVWRRNLG